MSGRIPDSFIEELLGQGDEYPPYTVAWDAGDGGVPAASEDSTDAYNIIASVVIGSSSDDECGLVEPVASEGMLLYLTDDSPAGIAEKIRSARARYAEVMAQTEETRHAFFSEYRWSRHQQVYLDLLERLAPS